MQEILISTKELTGKAYINYENDTETLDPMRGMFIPWKMIYYGVAKLYSLILTDNIYLLHLMETQKDRFYVSYESIAKDSSAFDSEFRKLWPDGLIHSNKSIDANNSVKDELQSILYNTSSSAKKKIVKRLIKVLDTDSLESKISFALNQYKQEINDVLNYPAKITIPEVALFCSAVRNDVDHGNRETYNLVEKEAYSFNVLRALIYCIQLSRIGIKKEDIKVIINKLFIKRV